MGADPPVPWPGRLQLLHLVNLGAYEDGESLIGAIVDDAAWRRWRESDDALFLFLDGLDEALLGGVPIQRAEPL